MPPYALRTPEMSQLLAADGRPLQSAPQIRPLMGEEILPALRKLAGTEGEWILEALDEWTKNEVALTSAANGEPAVFTLVVLPDASPIPFREADDTISMINVWPVQMTLIAKADAESALRQQPRWMRVAQAFIGVQVKDGSEQEVIGLTGFYGQVIQRFEKPAPRSGIAAA